MSKPLFSSHRFFLPRKIQHSSNPAVDLKSSHDSSSAPRADRSHDAQNVLHWSGAESGGMKIFSGNANPALAKDIAAYLGINLGRVKVRKRFLHSEVGLVGFKLSSNFIATIQTPRVSSRRARARAGSVCRLDSCDLMVPRPQVGVAPPRPPRLFPSRATLIMQRWFRSDVCVASQKTV